MKRIYTEDQLNELCKQYQKLLRLQDWDVSVILVDQMSIPDMEAQICRQLSDHKAIISIPTPETYASAVNPDQNFRFVLLHELLHLHFNQMPFEKHSTEDQLFELGINRIAAAVLSLVEDKATVQHPQHSTTICPRCKELTQTDADGELKDGICDGCKREIEDDKSRLNDLASEQEKSKRRLAESRECPNCKRILNRDFYVYPDGTDYFEQGATMCTGCADGFDKDFRCHVCGEKYDEEDMKTTIIHQNKPETDSEYNVCQSCFDTRGELYKAHAQTIAFECGHCGNVNPHYCMEKVDDQWQCKKPYGACWENVDEPETKKPIGEPCDATEFYKITPEQAHFYANRYQCHHCKMWLEGMNMETYFYHNNPVKDYDSHLNLCKDCNATIGNEKEDTPKQMPGSPRAG